MILGKPPTRDELASLVGRVLALSKPLPEEVADAMAAMLGAAMGKASPAWMLSIRETL